MLGGVSNTLLTRNWNVPFFVDAVDTRIPGLVRAAICQRNGAADDNWNVKDGNGNRAAIWWYPTAVNKMTSGTIGARDESYDYRAGNSDRSCKSLRASIVSGEPRYESKFNYAKPLKARRESIEPLRDRS